MSGGYLSYLLNMLPRLAADDRLSSILCVSPARIRLREKFRLPEKVVFRDCAAFTPLNIAVRKELHSSLSVFAPDVMFVPIARPVRFLDVPVVTMIQDMAPLVPHSWYGGVERIKMIIRRMEAGRAVRTAARVIAISGFVRDMLAKDWAVGPESTDLIYFGSPAAGDAAEKPGNFPAGREDFVFTAGSIEPYRGLEDLIECAKCCLDRGEPAPRIIVAGTARTGMLPYEKRLKEAAGRAGVSRYFHWAGQLPEAEMTWYYRHCAAFVMTSRVEACPNVALEAMACGALLVAADNPPLPEFFSDSAVYYSPGDGRALCETLLKCLALSPDRKLAASGRARERSLGFSWDIAADKTITSLARAAAGRGAGTTAIG